VSAVTPSRPSADALLAETQRHERGRLKIFLGAAPGVGKTFEMLTQARRKQAEGIDVVIGIVETHGREETLALVHDLPQLPRRTQEHRGRVLDELDLDAVLERHPQLVLVDELAHTNVPGSRHAKRHQDVQELLDAGIDVYTSLNVQHLESYNDLVLRIAGVEVRETVPDSVLDMATDIELIDLPPDDLIERLRQGKVYIPEQAQRALENFFTRGNLLALRELALRAAAARVDDDLSNFMRAHGIEGPWPTRGRLLVCIDATEGSEDLLRSAKRLAEQRHLPWTALHVQTLGTQSYAGAQQQLEANLALAAELGAESASITADRIGNGVLDYARASNVAQIVVGRAHSSRWWRRSLAEWLFVNARDFEITVVTADSAASAITPRRTSHARRGLRAVSDRALAYAIGLSVLTITLSALLDRWLGVEDLSAVLLLGVAAAGVFGGLASALIACGISFLAGNFFFTEPRYTLQINSTDDVRTLVVFLMVGAVVGVLSGRLQRQAVDARRNTLRTAMLFDFARRLATAVNERDLRQAAAIGIEEILGMRCLVLSATGDGRMQLSAELQRSVAWRDTEIAAANWALQHQEVAGSGTSTLPAATWCFFPLISGEQSVGVIALEQRAGAVALSAEESRLLHSLQAQVATAWERFTLLRHAQDAKVQRVAEGLRSALLASVSHDLRTPLVSVIGSLSAIRELAGTLNEYDQAQLVNTALLEAERLNRLIQNLLDATRVAQGGMNLQLSTVAVDEVLHGAVQRLGQAAQSRVRYEVQAALPAARADRALLEQTLINLLENALKYSPADTPILLSAEERAGRVLIGVADSGPGIDPAERARIFDFFYRVTPARQGSRGDSGVVGSGLGLAICKGFVEAMGGRITVQAGEQEHGTKFLIDLPIDESTLHMRQISP
jgi:two-component system, OmpR family, sensor histidine kinase KdpD